MVNSIITFMPGKAGVIEVDEATMRTPGTASSWLHEEAIDRG
jgi:hypothetical protein